MVVDVAREDGIGWLRINFPPMNVLSIAGGVVAGLRSGLAELADDPSVEAIIVSGAGNLFSAGADIKDFDGDPAALGQMRALMHETENCPKPVIAAIHGMALGGGLELALACHYRVAAADAKLGFPEVTLGLVPGAGGTQRLPRLAPPEEAIALITSGKPIDATKALQIGLVDRVGTDGIAEARALLAERPGATRVGGRAVKPGLREAVEAARARLKPGALNQAPAAILDCLFVAEGPLEAGLAEEAKRFDALMQSEASLGLRHAFFGQRKVSQLPGIGADVKPRPIASVAIVGGGLMGTGIATALLNADLPVTLIEPREDARGRAAASIGKTIRRDAEKGRISTDRAEQRIARLTVADAVDAASGADLVIEAVFEDMGVKEEVFRALDRVTAPHAILASNTSTLDLDAIAELVADPSRVVGLHFFSPANIMRLLEIVRGRATAPDVLATAMAFARQIGKVGVVAGVCDGFIGNRIFEEYLRQAYFLAEEGATPQQIDAAMERWGMAMGPFRTMDLAGQDIGWSIRKRRAAEQPDRPYSTFPDKFCELGRFGQKVGKGVYLYADGRTATVDPEMDALLIAHSAGEGITRRSIDDAEIVERCLLAMINEGARILDEGIAYRPVDIDIIYLNGYGFAPERGGPMFQADRIGLSTVVARMEALAQERHGWVWEVSPLLRRLAEGGETFTSLNR